MPSQKRVLNQKKLFLSSQLKQTYVLGTQKNRLNETYDKTGGKEFFYNFTINFLVYLNLCICKKSFFIHTYSAILVGLEA